jgi:dienelactone hydrolase
VCHYDAPPGGPRAPVRREELTLPLPDGEGQPAFLAWPEAGYGPPVLVIHDIWGTSPFYQDLAARLAGEGYTALLPDFFYRDEPLPAREYPLAFARRDRLDQHRTLRELNVALEWLAERTGATQRDAPSIARPATSVAARNEMRDSATTAERSEAGGRSRRIGTIGVCLGGTFGLDLAAERDDLGTVCYYGFPAGDSAQTPLTAPTPLSLADRIHGPIIGFWGANDHVCGIPNVEKLSELLRARGVDYEQHIYPDVGHAFLSAGPSDEAAYAAVQDSWGRTLAFYRKHLG